MKTLTKLLATATVLTISVSVFAHMRGGNEGLGFQHRMMDADNPHYQAMKKLQDDPEAMQAWIQNMHESPEAMLEWMQQVHGENFTNGKGGFGCHGHRFINNENTNSE